MSAYHSESLEQLFEVILSLENKDECRALIEDLCTIKEMKDLSSRLEVAFMLDEGKNYQQIALETGVSTATISRVKKCLEYGSGGYQRAIERNKESRKS